VTQAAVITPSQYQSLDSDKQEIIREILATVLDDLLVDPTEDNAGHRRLTVFLVGREIVVDVCRTDATLISRS